MENLQGFVLFFKIIENIFIYKSLLFTVDFAHMEWTVNSNDKSDDLEAILFENINRNITKNVRLQKTL